jgi:hypothetical protein
MFGILAGVAEEVTASVEVHLERLEAQICEGAAHLAAGVGRWLLLVGEFDRRKGYERWECRSTAFWLNWQCGISVRTAQEQVRVGRALLDYPRTAEALCSGQLSYSKVRAISRVVTPETETTLIGLASAVPTSQIERVVAGRKRVDANEKADAPNGRHLDAYYDEDGSLVGMFRLGPDEGAALLAALTLGKDVLRDQKRSAERSDAGAEPNPEADDCSPEPLRPKVANADALALMVETMLGADHTKDISRHERTLVVVHLDPDRAHLHEGPNISTETAKRMSCDSCVCGVLMRDNLEILDLGRTKRLPNRAQRRALMVRDGGCRFPGCTERRYVEAHHVRHWTDGGPTDLDNLLLLCWLHHHAVHEGGFRMSFEHGVVTVWRPDRTLLRSESLVAEGPGIVEQNEALGLRITPEFVASQWDGTPLTSETLSDTVAGLLWLEDQHRRDVEATNSTVTAAEPDQQGVDADYPAVIVIDDDCDEDLALAEDRSAVVIAD